jgi:hypothetical protein
LGKVVGTVTLDGKPLPDATVAFTPMDGQMSHGMTDAAGKFSLKFQDGRPGTMLGENQVSIETLRWRPNAAGEVIEYPELVPAKYNVETELIRSVERGEQEFNFELSSEP